MGTIPKIGDNDRFTGRVKAALDADYESAGSVAAEATARANADTANATAIADEATARANADSANATAIGNEVTARTAGDNALDTRLDTLEGYTTGGGYLVQSVLDARYVNELAAGHMVTIGSSNSQTATLWPAGVATDLGLTNHNYSVGGGSFTGSGPGRFENQLDVAIADTSFPKADVRVFLVADAGNDMRAVVDIADEAEDLFLTIRANYPNARIIVLPAVWNLDDDNADSSGRMKSVVRRYYEMTKPAATYGVELINYSWTWHFDSSAWIESGGSGVHLSTDGYTLIRHMVTRYIKNGGDTDRPLGWKLGTAKPAVPADYMYLGTSRTGNVGHIQGSFISNDLAVDTEIAQMQEGANPFEAMRIPCISNSRTIGTLLMFPRGLVRSFGALDSIDGETWHVNYTYPVF